MATTYFQTYKEIQDKLADIIRTEFRGFSVYFDDNYVNRKPSYFNILKIKDELVENLVPQSQIRNYGFRVKYYLRRPNYSKDLVLNALFRIGDRINQLIYNNSNVKFYSNSKDYYFTDGHFSNYTVRPTRDESEDINELHIASFDFDVMAFEVVK
tara:strand:- start:2538 stop:3002 length:465 start_codon:yes stop_codon:yes gene_type:complete